MSLTSQSEPQITIIGISVRTANSNLERLIALWRRFYSEQLIDAIPQRLSDDYYSVYSNYESDATGEYDLTIGCAVPPETIPPEGMVKQTIPAANYAVLDATGPMPESIQKAWMTIWQSPIRRSYQTDYERYQSNGTVTVHVGVL